jgi:hypothetical protein
MTTQAVSFFGAVLRAVACTPNLNPDLDAYERGVLEPCRTIRTMAERTGSGAPTAEDTEKAIALLVGILRTKRVDDEEIRARLEEIAKSSGTEVERRAS